MKAITDVPLQGLEPKLLPPNPQRKGEDGLRYQRCIKLNGDDKAVKAQPLITVITVVFNGAKTLEQTILSVVNQTYKNVEFIIIDGGSTDGTLDIIRKYEYAIDYWVSEPDKGIYDAWNKGLAKASGEWIAFLGSDDIYLEGAIDAYANLIIGFRDRPVDYISSRINLIKDNKVLRTIGQQWNWKSFKKNMNVAHVGSLHRHTLFEKYGLFDVTYKICGDYELLLRPRENLQAEFINITTVDMRLGGVSNSNSSVFYEVARIKISHGLLTKFWANLDLIYSKFKYFVRSMVWY
jgi:glycosyltransferase involved in cell wall biosynthesis